MLFAYSVSLVEQKAILGEIISYEIGVADRDAKQEHAWSDHLRQYHVSFAGCCYVHSDGENATL